VKAQLRIGAGNQARFDRRQLRETYRQRRCIGRTGRIGRALRQAQIQLEVPRFGALQPAIEAAEWLRQPCGQQAEALARARLDQGAGKHQVELAQRLVLAQSRSQPGRVAPGPLAFEAHLQPPHQLRHLLEMTQLLARQPRQHQTQ